MKKPPRIFLTFLLSLSLLTGTLPVSSALEMSLPDLQKPQATAAFEAAPDVYETQANFVDEQSARMKYLSSVFTDLSISNGQANCQGNYTTFKDVTVLLTVTLQRSTVNSTSDVYWSNVENASWSQTWTGVGQNIINRIKNISSGYYYRVKTTATVLSGASILESYTVHSVIRQY